MTATHAETATRHEHDQWDYCNGQSVSTENAAYVRQTMRRFHNSTLPSHETSGNKRSEARRKVLRQLMFLPDYSHDTQWWHEHDLQVADCVPAGRPDIVRTHERLLDRCSYGGCGIGGEPSFRDNDSRDRQVEYVGLCAGRGTLETAVRNLGGATAMLAEQDPVARVMLRMKFPGALIIGGFDDGDWRHWQRNTTAALGILPEPPCGPSAPSGKGRFLYGSRAQYLLGIGNVACALRPETVDIEALYGIADDKGARALAKIDGVLDAAD